jgi:hypothetical protein
MISQPWFSARSIKAPTAPNKAISAKVRTPPKKSSASRFRSRSIPSSRPRPSAAANRRPNRDQTSSRCPVDDFLTPSPKFPYAIIWWPIVRFAVASSFNLLALTFGYLRSRESSASTRSARTPTSFGDSPRREAQRTSSPGGFHR